ncbi:MAG: LLM class flavin-dependent oxidoreductase [Myxococcota bacterium]
MKISIGVPPGPQTKKLALLAEELGYERIWLFDSAALYEDIWAHLALIADATERIGLGTAVLVPNLRHVMTTASAVAMIERMAPGRLACAIGTGFTARMVLDQKPLLWKDVRLYVEQLRGLLRGEVVEIDGKPCQMIHHPEMAKARPIDIPILLSALGPKGTGIAAEIADGWMGVAPPSQPFDWAVQMVNGSVLEGGESRSSSRVIDAVGPWHSVVYHSLWLGSPEAVDVMPGGAAWRAEMESERPEAERHLTVHEGHCSHVVEKDRHIFEAAGDDIGWLGWVGSAEEVRQRAEASAAAGVSEIIYTPSGSDLDREVRAFYEAVSPLAD